MKTLVSVTVATAALLLAGGASAQIVGGVGGQVGGSVGVGIPQTGSITQGVGSIARDGVRTTRDTVSDTRATVREIRPDVGVNANANVRAEARSDRDGAEVDAAIQTGAMVRSSDGAILGSVVNVTRNTAGRATAFVVRSADGASRTIPAGSVSANGNVLVTGWTESQFNQRPQ
ncbi:hypothetical protein [Brevundimonas sp.]|uniref:hypothetical protein n=1 Tax=Brevundimonas sp. TaxID=1871086 RepID=UPI002FC5B24A